MRSHPPPALRPAAGRRRASSPTARSTSPTCTPLAAAPSRPTAATPRSWLPVRHVSMAFVVPLPFTVCRLLCVSTAFHCLTPAQSVSMAFVSPLPFCLHFVFPLPFSVCVVFPLPFTVCSHFVSPLPFTVRRWLCGSTAVQTPFAFRVRCLRGKNSAFASCFDRFAATALPLPCISAAFALPRH